MFNDDIYPPTKDFVPLYVRQPCSLQIIQLVECSSPPPQQNQNKYTPSRISSSSSSYSDSQSDSSAYDSSSPSSLSDASSYCSSAEQDGSPPMPPSFTDRDPSVDDTYRTRQRRVSLWRDAVYSKDDTALACPASPCQNRKTPDDDDLRDNDSITSHTPRKSPRSSLSAHSCPACDEDFSSPYSLRQHASTSKTNEACRIAVEYGFE